MMNMRTIVQLGVLLLFALGGADGRAIASPPLEEILSKLDAKAADIESLTAKFVEEKHTPLLKKPLRSTGTIAIKGNRTRWDTVEPAPSVMTTSEDEIRIYDPDAGTLDVYSMDRRLASLAITPLPRLATIREHFEIEGRTSDVGEEGAVALRLTPRSDALREHVSRVDVWVDVELGCARRVEILTADGDQTTLRFDSIRTNVNLSDADVTFDPPSGTIVNRSDMSPADSSSSRTGGSR